MNSSSASLVGILDSLSIRVSRTSIRFAHTQPRTRYKKKKDHLTGFGPSHGEQIFVFNHIENGMVIYSHESKLKRDSEKYLSQIPFTVKKQKPPVIRGDYWRPLCMIQFGHGLGVVGRNVFQKLREFRALHELEWGWQTKEFQTLNRRDRGMKILNQKPNAVADMAAVLGGAGRGNLMWTTEPLPAEENPALEAAKEVEDEVEAAQAAEAATAASDTNQPALEAETKTSTPEPTAAATSQAETPEAEGTLTAAPKGKKKSKPAPPPKRLHQATIYWANDADLYWARKWTDNVIHEVGKPDGVEIWRWATKEIMSSQEEEVAPEEESDEGAEGGKGAGSAEAGAEDVEGKESEPKEKQEPVEEKESEEKESEEKESEEKEKERKKGWFGWLGGKTGGSGQDART